MNTSDMNTDDIFQALVQGNTPMSFDERRSAAEVISQYDLPRRRLPEIARRLRDRALETDRPFKAYDAAHAICAAMTRGE